MCIKKTSTCTSPSTCSRHYKGREGAANKPNLLHFIERHWRFAHVGSRPCTRLYMEAMWPATQDMVYHYCLHNCWREWHSYYKWESSYDNYVLTMPLVAVVPAVRSVAGLFSVPVLPSVCRGRGIIALTHFVDQQTVLLSVWRVQCMERMELDITNTER